MLHRKLKPVILNSERREGEPVLLCSNKIDKGSPSLRNAPAGEFRRKCPDEECLIEYQFFESETTNLQKAFDLLFELTFEKEYTSEHKQKE
jgi:hypothetical protein